VWRIRNGKKVHVGSDPWLGVGNEYILSEKLINALHEAEIFYLADVKHNPLNSEEEKDGRTMRR
jgi:hypothetical protein